MNATLGNGAEGSAAFLDYAVRWRAGDPHPGKHATRHSGSGGSFRAIRPFWQLPDARHIDIRRTMLDPFDTVMVRQMENRGSIAVVLAVDLSASMAAGAAGSWLGDIARLVRAAARAAQRAGDAFGFFGFDTVARTDFWLPPTRLRGAAEDLAGRLAAYRPLGRGASGISALAELLPARRCLVVLISDFLMPLAVMQAGLDGMVRHDVAPVVLHDARAEDLPRVGLLRLRDAETGRSRLLLMRPALRRRWQAARAARMAALEGVFAHTARPAFHARAAIDVAALGAHLRAV